MYSVTYIDVAVEAHLYQLFTYSVPRHLAKEIEVGKRIIAPFGRRLIVGHTINFRQDPDVDAIKDIIDIVDCNPIFDEKRLEFYKWLSSYYCSPLGITLGMVCPGTAKLLTSQKYFLTVKGKAGIACRSDEAKAILRAAEQGVSLSEIKKRFGAKARHSLINQLKQEGMLREEVGLKKGTKIRRERFLDFAENRPGRDMPSNIGRKQSDILNYIAANGETSLRILRKEMGGIDYSVKRLIEKGTLKARDEVIERDPFDLIKGKMMRHNPNEEQSAIINEIMSSVESHAFAPFLIHGVTGSGKTLVYLKMIESVLSKGRRVIFLVPEISLTPWPAGYLSYLFPGRVAIMHSGLTVRERFDQWLKIREGRIDVVIGARSALFAPVKNLGLIIVDEEHEASYKQTDGVRYNARDSALMLGKMLQITVILGSATPSVETYYNAEIGKIALLQISSRVRNKELPEIKIIDMRREKIAALGGAISVPLASSIKNVLSMQGQVLLFLNRRGFASFLICRDCGYTFTCRNCSVSLTLHKSRRLLLCHYCDYVVDIPKSCPSCNSLNVSPIGFGTEKVEEEVISLFPEARVARMDRDTTRKRGSYSRIIESMERGEIDILIGTQMIAKGHHFPRVALSGVISADTSMNIPDFRSSERTFQLLTQVAGRSGRGDFAGEVLVQTYNPDYKCFRTAVNHNYKEFFEDEIEMRREVGYPPLLRLVSIRVEGNSQDKVIDAINRVKMFADMLLSKTGDKILILGPAPAFILFIRGKYRWHMLVKGKDVGRMHSLVRKLRSFFEGMENVSGLKFHIDVDPIGT